MIAEDIRVLFQDRWADPRLDQTGTRELVDERRGVVAGREGRERLIFPDGITQPRVQLLTARRLAI